MLIKTDTQEYPVTLQDFFARHRNVSFPAEIPFEDFGYAQVVATPQPEVDFYHAAHELPPALVGDAWTQQWEVVSVTRTPEEIAAKQRADILAQIVALESQQTPRMLREAALGINGGKELLAEINTQIDALRAQLPAA